MKTRANGADNEPLVIKQSVRIGEVVTLINKVAPFPENVVKYWVSEGVLRPEKNGHYRFDESECLYALLAAELSTCRIRGVGLEQAITSFRTFCDQWGPNDPPLREALKAALDKHHGKKSLPDMPVIALVRIDNFDPVTGMSEPLYLVEPDIRDTVAAIRLKELRKTHSILTIPLERVVRPLIDMKNEPSAGRAAKRKGAA